jgi:hypothetical protein
MNAPRAADMPAALAGMELPDASPVSAGVMLPRTLAPLTLALTLAVVPSCSKAPPGPTEVEETLAKASRSNLTPFRSERELKALFDDLAAAAKRDQSRRAKESVNATAAAPAATAAAAAEPGSAKADESITNTQHAGVDEGGIVKVHGDHLVVLRRGRLFTIRIGDDRLEPISHVDAFGPDVDPGGAWYDEMLVAGDTIVVIGYSYQRGGTEVALFDIDRAGGVSYRATYHLRSNDYYSSRNYASRVIGDKLVFYTPSYLSFWGDDPMATFPAVRRWHRGATSAEFKRILAPTSIYRPVDGFTPSALHTVTVCDLSQRDLPCTGTAVMGPPGRVFYVSSAAVYVWMTEWGKGALRTGERSMVVRMPLDGAGPSALETAGSPVDQFSFLEQDGHLNVLVRADARGDAMWAPETSAGDVALMRVPLGLFSEAVANVPRARYASLPQPKGNAWAFQNRFVGDYLLYGTGSSWGGARPDPEGAVHAYRFAGQGSAVSVRLPHPVDRIEALGRNAVVIGGDGRDLHFSAVALGSEPRVAGAYVRPGASQGETRSHGFFYKAESDREGILGLPIRSAGRPGSAQLGEGSASVVFVKNQALDFQPLGEIEASTLRSTGDGCRASCVDWYGNARPVFLRGRVFALMGYELVEGAIREGHLEERRRVSFAPQGR